MTGEPARGRDERLARAAGRDRSRAGSARTTRRGAPSTAAAACSPTGRCVGIAPHAIQPPPSRKRESATASSRSSAPTSKWTTWGPASSARRRSPWPHTCTPDTPPQAASARREQIGRGLTLDRALGVAPAARARARRGSTASAAPGSRADDQLGDRAAPRRGRRARRAGTRARRPARVDERDAERQRTGDLHLDALRRTAADAPRHRGRSAGRRGRPRRTSAADGPSGSTAERELDRAVVVHDDTGHRAGPLRDDAFARRATRKLRRGGQLGQATQRERGGRVRVAMRKTADRSRHPRADRPAEQCSPMKIRRIGATPAHSTKRSAR